MRTRLSTIVKWFVTGLVFSFFVLIYLAVLVETTTRTDVLGVLLTLVSCVCISIAGVLITIIVWELMPNDLSLPRFSISRMGIHRVRERELMPPDPIIYSGGSITVDSANTLFTPDYHVSSSTDTQFWADQAPITSWPTPSEPSISPSLPESRRRRRRRSPIAMLLETLEEARRTERITSGRRRSLQHIPDHEYIALGQALHADFNGRRRSIFEISERNQAEQNRLTRIRWAEHRRNEPNCDCHRCQTYRGEVGEEAEDPLGW